MSQKFTIVLIIFYSLFSFGQKQKDFIIASGSRGGNYYQYAQHIAQQYNRHLKDYFHVIETNGSNENIKLLKNNSVDFAIIQRNILLNNIYDEDEGTKNISIISPLFQEKLWIYYTGDKDLNLHDLDSLSSIKKRKIGFTSRNGYSYNLFKTLIKFLNIDYSNVEEHIKNYDSLYQDLYHDRLDLLVSFSLPLKALDTFKSIHKFYISKKDAKLLENRMHNVYAASIDSNKYTLGSWSFLVGAKTAISKIKKRDKLLSALITAPEDKKYNNFYTNIYNSYNKFLYDNATAHQLKNIPVYSALRQKLGFKSMNWQPYFFFALLILFLFGMHRYISGRWFPKYNLKFFWNRYKHFQVGFITLIIIYFSSVELLVYAEKLFYQNIGIKSQILNMTRPDLHSWIFVTTVTGNSNGIFPLSLMGKIMLSLNSLNFWIGTILIGVSEYVTYQANKKRKKGLMKTKFEKHLVIFGWNDSTENFVLNILEEAKIYNDTQIKVVLVIKNIEEIREKHAKIKEQHDNKIIDIISGDARDVHTLEKAHVEMADSIILLSEDSSRLSDERTLLRAMAISRYVKKAASGKVYKTTGVIEKAKQFFGMKKPEKEVSYKKYKIEKTSDRAYMIAEINNEEFKESLIEAEVNEIVVAGNYRKAIMKQALFNHGISKVLDEIMQYNEYNEFYKIDLSLPENAHLVDKTFDELLILLRQKGILLIGVHIIFHDINDNIIIDQNIIKELLEKEENGITRDVIVNPTDEIERNRKTDADDHLIVLALNVKMLRKGIKELQKEMPL